MKMDAWPAHARKLFKSEDSDPGYMALARADLPTPQKMRYMVGWVTYYNPGIAAQASERSGRHFWDYLRGVYDTAKRATERRHFRGRAGLVALDAWQRMFPDPEDFVEHMMGDTYFDVRRAAKTVPQIGTYFVWKFADVQERVFRQPCDFSGAADYMPDLPKQGAQVIAPGTTYTFVTNMIAEWMNGKGMEAPPWYDRPMNVQEAETVCCVYKQYLNGNWKPLSRTAKAVRRLASNPCRTSDALLDALSKRHRRLRDMSRGDALEWASTILD